MTIYAGIDPSTKTGVVVIDHNGVTLCDQEITSELQGPARMREIIDRTMSIIDFSNPAGVCIEGFAFGAKGKAVDWQYGIGWGLRVALYDRSIGYREVTPNQLKKYASGNHQAKKENLILPIHRHWGFESSSDNVRDAYVLAQIARSLDMELELTQYQREVLDALQGKKVAKKRTKK
ncbi:crossover junction endodeoxyribonuclease RuvC [Paenibacillus elgii]